MPDDECLCWNCQRRFSPRPKPEASIVFTCDVCRPDVRDLLDRLERNGFFRQGSRDWLSEDPTP